MGSADGNVVERFVAQYGKASGVILLVLFVTRLPIISLIRILPTFKELVLGAVVVAAFTQVVDRKEGAKYALIAGMAAAVVFNVINIPLSIILGSVMGAGGAFGSSGAENAAAAGGIVGALGALSNLIGLLIFSPIGYGIGGVIGTFINE